MISTKKIVFSAVLSGIIGFMLITWYKCSKPEPEELARETMPIIKY